jgi:hypothetical protein
MREATFKPPPSVVAEARRGLAWRRATGRGGTNVGLVTAHILASGRALSLRKVRHIARYFARHEVDSRAKGWRPRERGYPSNGRIAWALWGGWPGWRWSRSGVLKTSV